MDEIPTPKEVVPGQHYQSVDGTVWEVVDCSADGGTLTYRFISGPRGRYPYVRNGGPFTIGTTSFLASTKLQMTVDTTDHPLLTEREKAERDAVLFGTGFLMMTRDGEKYIPAGAVSIDRRKLMEAQRDAGGQ